MLLEEPPLLEAQHVGGDGLKGLDPELILVVVIAPDVGVDCVDQSDDLWLVTVIVFEYF